MKPEIRKPTKAEAEEAKNWPIWEKEVSSFPWEYTDKETCLLIEGDVVVTNEDGEEFNFGAGDYIVFPVGMKCKWDIKKAVRKYYQFG